MNDRRFLLARDMTAEEIAKDLPCFVQHEDAGGRCPEKASTVNFCEAHGSEVASGALLGARQEAADFFERPRNPYVPSLPGLIDEELEALTERLRSDTSDDSPYHRALSRAYPEVPEGVRREIDGWKRDEAAGMLTVEDSSWTRSQHCTSCCESPTRTERRGLWRIWSSCARGRRRGPPTSCGSSRRRARDRERSLQRAEVLAKLRGGSGLFAVLSTNLALRTSLWLRSWSLAP